ncbi:PAS domain-containing hybrid sensor histidine kinase/response regulator [Marinobacterium arenosum]|uniref:PAS domain-containing hybrid sensor histidine kinase/response regulator n=1 Tax=Marinobacterium arenosum TaxID=2862496 RepID=UPI001C954EC3|nr:NahK/ErcS family hybrid sensor histidine kinase/response regulator [Marinobacterium arenosum]MBY4675874.1 PAS domain S-box protein [Marinobacterium arenosum]
MKKRSEASVARFEDLIGLGDQSARKTYHAELTRKLDELEAERNRYKWLFENALHGIFQADLNGGILTANPAIARICGYDSPAAVCQQVSDLAGELFCCPEDLQRLTERLLNTGKMMAMETQLRRRDGSCVDVSMNVLLKPEGERPVIEAFVQDITERKRAQNALKQLNEELEGRVEERTEQLLQLNEQLRTEIDEREQVEQQLKVAKEQAEQANRSKDKYLAAASHDLLQPMNAARLLVAALRERPLEQQDGYLVERVHLALEGAEELLTDLLDISKLDQNAVKPELCEFPLGQLLDSLAAEFQPVAEAAGLELRVQSSGLYLRSDTRLLMRILRNFISNAIRYTDSGRVLLGCRRRGDRLSLQVWDSGSGIPADRIDDIFREFQQLHRQGERKGVGLGLAIVERIARMLEHPIEVRSELGRGSMFAIEVPLAVAIREQRIPTAPQIVLNALDGCRLLVVDNEESILVSMRALLGEWGAEVAVAQDRRQALKLCQAGFRPDVVLADYHLADQDTGTGVIAALRARYGPLPALLITADRSDACRQLFRELELPVLNKPVKPGKLRALLTHLLTERPPAGIG